ncbi:MAG: hypothetical protein AAB465_01960, partial [Patescibacteria group bacterium]
KSYIFSAPEQYFYINIIPSAKIFGLSANLCFYIFLFAASFIVLIFYFNHKTNFSFNKIFLAIILFFWLLSSVHWFAVQINWLIQDFKILSHRNLSDRQAIISAKFLFSSGTNGDWLKFHSFLLIAKKEIPAGASAFLLPDYPVFKVWAKYWLYPEIRLKENLPVDYLIIFNVKLTEKPENFEIFRSFGPGFEIWEYNPVNHKP